MNEATQQAIYIGVSVTIFILALSVGISLMMGIRDVTDKAIEFDASVPTGSRIVSVDIRDKRIIKGYEIISYFSNYISDKKIQKSGRFIVKLSDEEIMVSSTIDNLLNKIDISKDYEIIIEKYNEINDILTLNIKEI